MNVTMTVTVNVCQGRLHLSELVNVFRACLGSVSLPGL